MGSVNVLFTGELLSPAEISRMAKLGLAVDVAPADLDEAGLAAALHGKDAYIIGGVEYASAAVLAAAQRLKVVAFLGTGYHSFIDVPAATARGIAVTNAPGANAQGTAEFAVALLMDAWRRVTYLANETRAGRWPEMLGRDLRGKTLGIVGMGAIGTIVARIASRGLGMRVCYTSRSPKPTIDRQLGVQRVPLMRLLAESDAITLHLPCDPENRGLLGAGELAVIKRGAVLVNTSPAALVDPEALLAALSCGQLGAAALDGYYREPAPDIAADPYGLLALAENRLIVTPHTANATRESFEATLAINIESILNVVSRGHDSRIVNPGFREHASWLPNHAGSAG